MKHRSIIKSAAVVLAYFAITTSAGGQSNTILKIDCKLINREKLLVQPRLELIQSGSNVDYGRDMEWIDGAYEGTLPKGRYIVRLQAAGLKTFEASIAAWSDRSIFHASLAPSVVMPLVLMRRKGRVICDGMGCVDGFWIRMMPIRFGTPITDTEIGPNGEFNIEVLEPGSYLVALMQHENVRAVRAVGFSHKDDQIVFDIRTPK